MSKIVMPDGSEIHCQSKDPPRIGICKFCGNTPRTLVPFSTGYNVYCEKCKAAGPIGMTMERAVELWNGGPRCGECKYYDGFAYCDNPEMKSMMSADEGPYSVIFSPTKNFGCMYWEKK